jgi:hypothetical protein
MKNINKTFLPQASVASSSDSFTPMNIFFVEEKKTQKHFYDLIFILSEIHHYFI